LAEISRSDLSAKGPINVEESFCNEPPVNITSVSLCNNSEAIFMSLVITIKFFIFLIS